MKHQAQTLAQLTLRKQFEAEKQVHTRTIEDGVMMLNTTVMRMLDEFHTFLISSLVDHYKQQEKYGGYVHCHIQTCDAVLDRIRQAMFSYMAVTTGYNLLSLPNDLLVRIMSFIMPNHRSMKNTCLRLRKLFSNAPSSFGTAVLPVYINLSSRPRVVAKPLYDRSMILIHLTDVVRLFTAPLERDPTAVRPITPATTFMHCINFHNLHIPVDGTDDDVITLDVSFQFMQEEITVGAKSIKQYNRWLQVRFTKCHAIFEPLVMRLYAVDAPFPPSRTFAPRCEELAQVNLSRLMTYDTMVFKDPCIAGKHVRAMMNDAEVVTFGVSVEMQFMTQDMDEDIAVRYSQELSMTALPPNVADVCAQLPTFDLQPPQQQQQQQQPRPFSFGVDCRKRAHEGEDNL